VISLTKFSSMLLHDVIMTSFSVFLCAVHVSRIWPWALVGFIHALGWVGSEIFAYEIGWVELGLVARNFFFTTIIIPLRKSLTVIYHHSLHHEFFTQPWCKQIFYTMPQLPLGVAFYLIIGF